MFTDVANKQVGQFVGLYADQTVTFPGSSTYRVIVYAAERAGAICPEFNGVAVLRMNPSVAKKPGSSNWFVTKCRMAQAASGYYGMTVAQKALFDRLCAASLEEFLAILANNGELAALQD